MMHKSRSERHICLVLMALGLRHESKIQKESFSLQDCFYIGKQ